MPRTNPFRPNYPVSPGMFVGRIEEIERIERHLLQTKSAAPTNFVLTGERGIGKTSLLNYVKWAAQGDIPIEGQKLHFLVIDTDIDQSTTQLGLIRKIELGMRKQLAQTEKGRAFLADAWSFLSKIEAGGIKLGNTESKPDETLFDEFCYSIASVAERVCNSGESSNLFNANYDGILIFVDEADNASKNLPLGLFLKLMLERLDRRGCHTIMIGLAGLENLPKVLLEGHGSSLRMFETLRLNRLSPTEVDRVVTICLDRANQQNAEKTVITDSAKALLINLSEGYPHFVQQFGFSAFEVDKDNSIDDADVIQGAFGEGGALEQIGDRYYRDDFFNRIGKESYRQVLRIMADKLDAWVTKKEIRQRFKGTNNVLANALKALRDRHIILPKPGEKGVYRLQHKGFALWIKAYTSDPNELQKSFESIRTDIAATDPKREMNGQSG